jgi:hypothetical protein
MDDVLATAQALGDQNLHLLGLVVAADLHLRAGDHVAVGTCVAQVLDLAEALGDRDGRARALQRLGRLHHVQRHAAEAVSCLTEVVRIYRELDLANPLARALGDLAEALAEHGDHAAADATRREPSPSDPRRTSAYREPHAWPRRQQCLVFLRPVPLAAARAVEGEPLRLGPGEESTFTDAYEHIVRVVVGLRSPDPVDVGVLAPDEPAAGLHVLDLSRRAGVEIGVGQAGHEVVDVDVVVVIGVVQVGQDVAEMVVQRRGGRPVMPTGLGDVGVAAPQVVPREEPPDQVAELFVA